MTTPSRRRRVSRKGPEKERRSTTVKLERRKKPRPPRPEPLPQLPPGADIDGVFTGEGDLELALAVRPRLRMVFHGMPTFEDIAIVLATAALLVARRSLA